MPSCSVWSSFQCIISLLAVKLGTECIIECITRYRRRGWRTSEAVGCRLCNVYSMYYILGLSLFLVQVRTVLEQVN